MLITRQKMFLGAKSNTASYNLHTFKASTKNPTWSWFICVTTTACIWVRETQFEETLIVAFMVVFSSILYTKQL
jgi:hypothetical protein